MANEQGTKENPWLLKTPPLSSDFTMYKDSKDGKDILVCTVGKTVNSKIKPNTTLLRNEPNVQVCDATDV